MIVENGMTKFMISFSLCKEIFNSLLNDGIFYNYEKNTENLID